MLLFVQLSPISFPQSFSHPLVVSIKGLKSQMLKKEDGLGKLIINPPLISPFSKGDLSGNS